MDAKLPARAAGGGVEPLAGEQRMRLRRQDQFDAVEFRALCAVHGHGVGAFVRGQLRGQESLQAAVTTCEPGAQWCARGLAEEHADVAVVETQRRLIAGDDDRSAGEVFLRGQGTVQGAGDGVVDAGDPMRSFAQRAEDAVATERGQGRLGRIGCVKGGMGFAQRLARGRTARSPRFLVPFDVVAASHGGEYRFGIAHAYGTDESRDPRLATEPARALEANDAFADARLRILRCKGGTAGGGNPGTRRLAKSIGRIFCGQRGQHGTVLDCRKLIRIAEQDQSAIRLQRAQQLGHQGQIDHRAFVDDQHIEIERTFGVA